MNAQWMSKVKPDANIFLLRPTIHLQLTEFHNHNPTCISLPTSKGNTELLETQLKEDETNFAHHSRQTIV